MRKEFAGKRAAVLGAGIEGVSGAKWLAARGAAVTVCDRRGRKELGRIIRDLAQAGVSDWRFGPSHAESLEDFDLILRTQSRPFRSPQVQRALRAGVAVTSVTKLFFERCPARIVGVTGTKGKGTTASLLAAMLKAGGSRVHLGGNIGTPPLEFLGRVRKEDIVVLELSSFQLQDLDRSPQIAIVTNVTRDHLDHHASVREYREAKRSITRYQRRKDLSILNADDPGSRPFANDPGTTCWYSTGGKRRTRGSVKDGWLTIRDKPIVRASDLRVPGEHNQRNVLAAALAADALGAGPTAIRKAARAFRGLPYHLEYVGTRRGIRFFNDSYATNPVATIPAIESFPEPPTVVLGGSTKNLTYEELAKVVVRRGIADVVLLPPEGPRIADEIRVAARALNKPVPRFTAVRRKEDIVPAALRLTEPGGTVLFSPATASFGWFQDYRERGRYFTEQVKSL